jgi:hypothetical protein
LFSCLKKPERLLIYFSGVFHETCICLDVLFGVGGGAGDFAFDFNGSED